jgi:hypothetical protein
VQPVGDAPIGLPVLGRDAEVKARSDPRCVPYGPLSLLILLLARYVVKGLSGERKALIERYTIDADEALHREGIAEEAAREEASRTATHDPAGTWSRFAAPLVEPLLKLRRPAIRLVPSTPSAPSPPRTFSFAARIAGARGYSMKMAGLSNSAATTNSTRSAATVTNDSAGSLRQLDQAQELPLGRATRPSGKKY